LLFFWPIFKGQIPFPGDLLVSEYNPWKTYSYLGYNPGSYPNKAQYFDVLRQLYPWKTLSINQLVSSNIPLWNPYNFSGAPLLANFQSAVFYPFNVIYKFLPQIWTWSILVVSQPFLAAFFTFLYARKLGISKLGSFFSATSFAFSSFMTVWLEYNTIGHVILWLPFILLSIEHILEKKEIKWISLFILSITSSLLAGHIQVFAYLFCFLIVYFSFRNWSSYKRNFNRNFLIFFILFFLSLGIGSIQLIPGLELIKESARSPHSYELLINKILIQPWQLIMFFVPDFFGNPATRNYWLQDTYIGKVTSIGLISIFFILASVFSKKDSMKKFYIWVCISVLLMVTRNPLTSILYKIEIPFVSSSAPTLGVFLFCFGASILAGFGVDVFKKENFNLKKYFYFVLPIVFLLISLYTSVFVLNRINIIDSAFLQISIRNLSYSGIILVFSSILLFVGLVHKKLRYVILICLLILNIFDLLRLFGKFNPFINSGLVFSETPILKFLQKGNGINRFWGYGHGSIEANFATYYKLFSPDGYDPLYPKRYGEFIQSSKDGKIIKEFNNSTRSDAVIAPGYGKEELPLNNYRLKVLDLLGVKYILDRMENGSTEKTFSKDRFNLIYQKDGWKIFENLKVAPRMFLTSNYKIFDSDIEFEKLFFASDFNPSQTVLLENDISNKLSVARSKANEDYLKILSYKPQEIIFQVSAQNDKILFLSDTYYPGWKAYIDGRQTNIYRADYAFRAIVVPSGVHTGKFIYDPDSFRIGYMISFLSLGVLVIFLFSLSISRKSNI